MTDLNGKVALVTGGGRGLGEAICRVLASSGVMIMAADIREESASRVAAAVREAGGKSDSLKLDVSDGADAERAISETVKRCGKLDILINNAAVDVTQPIDRITVEDWDRIIGVNLCGPFYMSRQALMVMKQQASGHIVNIVSTAAKRTWENASAYHASKWGLLGFSHALHVEARGHNIKVMAVISGGMRTPFLLDRFPDINRDNLQDPLNVAETIRFALMQPPETVIPEIMVLPMRETSWP